MIIMLQQIFSILSTVNIGHLDRIFQNKRNFLDVSAVPTDMGLHIWLVLGPNYS